MTKHLNGSSRVRAQMGSVSDRVVWTLISVVTIAWLLTVGVYALVVVGISVDGRACYPTAGIDRTENSWLPPGYACRRVGPTYRADENEHTAIGVERVEGPGAGTAMIQLVLLVIPAFAWAATRYTSDPPRRRRDLAEISLVAGIGLFGLGLTAAAVGSRGLAAVYLLIGGVLGVFGFLFRWRTSSNGRAGRPLSAASQI